MRDSSKASAASQSSAVVGEDGMRSGGRPMVTAAAAHSTPARVMVRHPIGVSLNSPKQPQPRLGPTLPRLVQRAHGDQEEQRGPGAHDGRGQARAARRRTGRAVRDQREAQAELGRAHGHHDRPAQPQREQAGRVHGAAAIGA